MDVNTPRQDRGSEARPVVVGIDGSPAALRAAQWAAVEAAARQVPLRLVQVLPEIDAPAFRPGGVKYRGAVRALEKARDAAVGRSASDGDAGVPVVETTVLHGTPEHVLLELSADATLIALGTTDIGFFSHMVLGSTTLVVTRDAHCPVVLVRPSAVAAGPVLAVVSTPDSAGPTLLTAFRAAHDRGVDLIVARIWDGPGWITHWTGRTGRHMVPDAQILHYQSRYPRVAVSFVTMVGDIVDHVEHISGTAQLVIVANDPDFEHPDRLGRVADELVRHSPCSTMILPSREVCEARSAATVFTRS